MRAVMDINIKCRKESLTITTSQTRLAQSFKLVDEL